MVSHEVGKDVEDPTLKADNFVVPPKLEQVSIQGEVLELKDHCGA
jgi:hypothetical protein